eukprot:10914255-Ditylum_brightwellii.AAC.1
MIVKYWRQRITFLKRGKEDTKTLRQKLEDEIGVEVDIYQGNILRTSGGQLRKAVKYMKKCRNSSYNLRQECLESRAEELTTENEKEKAQIVQQIRSTESRKVMYRVLKRYLKPEDRAGLTQVDVPEWIRSNWYGSWILHTCLDIVRYSGGGQLWSLYSHTN